MCVKVKGVDISSLKEVETLGGAYYLDGAEKDLMEILKVKGINTIRLRLWLDPYDNEGNPYLGGTNDLNTTIELARRAKEHGMNFMLNLHYSDFWTDPKKQKKPKAWENLTGIELEKMVYEYTKQVLRTFDQLGLMPEYIQVGNEITNGMLWPDGKTATFLFEERKFESQEEQPKKESYDRLVSLLNAGIRATREVRSAAKLKIIIHLDFGGANNLYREWFDEVTKRHLDYDIIGLSYYPYWHGGLNELKDNLKDIRSRYAKEVMVVETAYAFTDQSPEGEDSIFNKEFAVTAGYPPNVSGQAEFLKDLMKLVGSVEGGLGIIYWEPAWLPVHGTSWASMEGMRYGNDMAKPGNHWANQGLFDFNGHALPSLDVFKAKIR